MTDKFERYSSYSFGQGNFEPHQRGLCFFHAKNGLLEDLGDVKLLASTVDTIRQLYSLLLCPSFLSTIEELYESSFEKSQYIEIHGVEFALGAGGKSGYKYRLQNNEEGVIVFLKNQKASAETTGSHLKIELSPHFLQANNVSQAQNFMDAVASWVSLGRAEPKGVATHLALDIQGWELPEDFLERLVMRFRRIYCHDGIEKADFTLSEAAVSYGKRETVTVGTVKSLQMCCYDKTLQAKKTDKTHYYDALWSEKYDDDLGRKYEPGTNVTRVEMRFHHSVVNQFAMGMGESLLTYKEVFEHLGGLWRYAMNNFRLEHQKGLWDPVWQLFSEDADFHWCHEEKEYKRAQKKPGVGNEKNVTLALGNMLSIYARGNMSAHKVMACLRKSGIYGDVLAYYTSRGLAKSDLYEFIRDSLKQRRLVGRAA